jgi:hypothetical protein
VSQPRVIELNLKRRKIVGYANYEENLIEIDPRQTAFEYFETLIHEKYHFQFKHFEEDEILRLAHDMAEFLWSQNYRKVAIK